MLAQAHTVLEAPGVTTATEDSGSVVQAPVVAAVSAAGYHQHVRLPSEAHLEETLVEGVSAGLKPQVVEPMEALAEVMEAPREVQGGAPAWDLMTLMEVTMLVEATLLAPQVEASTVVLDAGVEAWERVEAPMTNLQKAILAAATEEVALGRLEGEKENLMELVDPALDEEEALSVVLGVQI